MSLAQTTTAGPTSAASTTPSPVSLTSEAAAESTLALLTATGGSPVVPSDIASPTATNTQSSSFGVTSNGAVFGLGLGLGIPLVLGFIGAVLYCFRRSRRKKRAAMRESFASPDDFDRRTPMRPDYGNNPYYQHRGMPQQTQPRYPHQSSFRPPRPPPAPPLPAAMLRDRGLGGHNDDDGKSEVMTASVIELYGSTMRHHSRTLTPSSIGYDSPRYAGASTRR